MNDKFLPALLLLTLIAACGDRPATEPSATAAAAKIPASDVGHNYYQSPIRC